MAVALPFHLLVFLGSFLLFVLELMVGRMLLPAYGSSASVWTTCLVYYQGLLFLAYWYAGKVAADSSRLRRWGHLVLVFVPILTFPIQLPLFDLPPVPAILLALTRAIGLPFFVLATTSVVAQGWFTRTNHPRRADPYFLFASSNAGALAALFAYPFVVEPWLGLREQRIAWYVGYGVYVLLFTWSHTRVRPHVGLEPYPTEAAAGPVRSGADTAYRAEARSGSRGADRAELIQWVLLAAGANGLLMAVTSVVTLDAPVPLLWVVPLALYLGTLVVCFGRGTPSPGLIAGLGGGGVAVAAGAMLLLVAGVQVQAAFITIHAMILWVGALLCHYRLVQARPLDSPRNLGTFYLAVSGGGWLGATLVGLLIPLAFRWLPVSFIDYAGAFGLVLAALLVRDAAPALAYFRLRPSRAVLLLLMIGVGIASAVEAARNVLDTQVDGARTFYGIYRVTDRRGLRWFQNGNTIHGVQALNDEQGRMALGYYHPGSPIGALLAADLGFHNVGVVGLGAGAMAAYERPGQRWDFFELDPEVVRIARDDFSFLAGAVAPTRVIIGDARLTLQEVPVGRYDLLVLDTFSSDFLPLHLVTREALDLYLSRLAPDGVLVFHISSRVFDVLPVLGRLAVDLDLPLLVGGERGASWERAEDARFPSLWTVLTRNQVRRARLLNELGWKKWEVPEEVRQRSVWTDDHVNLFDAL